MKDLLASLAFLLIFSSVISAQDWSWRTFSPAQGSWTIYSPGAMNPDAEALESNSKMGSYSYSDFYGFFAVVYRDSKANFWSLRPDYSSYYEKVRNDFIKASKGQLLKEERYENGKRVGRDVQIKVPAGQITGLEGKTITKYRIERLRMFFVGKRFFILLAVLPEDIINTPPIDNFFNSFTTNSPPQAVADSYSVNEDDALRVASGSGVLANDTDAENDRLTATFAKPATMPKNGILVLNPDGSFIYTPDANFNGQDSFTYIANDGQVDSEIVTVSIKINPVNDAPTLQNVPPAMTIDELAPMTFTATANDIDNPVNSLRFSLSDAPDGATIDANTGTFKWTPTEAQGPSNLTFRVNVSDGAATTSGTISVNVNEVNAAPTISNVPATATINELTAYTFTATGSDTDLPKQTLTYSLLNAPAGATINPASGAFSWTPTEAQGNGSTYSFTVRVSDGAMNSDVPVKLVAQEVNSAPVLSTIAAQTVDELKPLSISVKASDADDPVNVLTYSLGNDAPQGMTIDAKTGRISWTPTEAQGAGNYSVTVKVTDNGSPTLSAIQTFNVRVNEVNIAPIASNSEISGVEDRAISFALKATDVDLPANNLTFLVVSAPSNGTLSGSGANLTYTPKADFNGTDSFTFKVNDGAADSATATVTLRIAPVNDNPIANFDSAATQENVPVVIKVLANDTDIDGDRLVLSNVSDAVGGKAEIVNGAVKFTPNQNFRGAGSFKYTISDGNGGTAVGSVTITVNAPPSGN